MKNSSAVVFTNNEKNISNLIELLKTLCNVDVCTYAADSWSDVDFYSKNLSLYIIDSLPESDGDLWILSKLFEDKAFSEIPVLFTSYNSLCEFEKFGFTASFCDVLPQVFDSDLTHRRIENAIEIFNSKQQVQNITKIHTKRILNQANKLKEQSSKMQTMNFDLVELLVAAIESRDLESGQHIKRIRFFTKALTSVVAEQCPEYNINDEQAEYIYFGSSVHDVGKIAIPDSILLKPGRLTKEEFDIMKTHTIHGSKLIDMLDEMNDSNYFKHCKDICLYHHERWSGNGYPFGLKGDEIPISAQIVAVCDCYDALTSERPYKKAMSHEEAVEVIMNGGCGTFSPQLLKCFNIALPEFARIEKELRNEHSPERDVIPQEYLPINEVSSEAPITTQSDVINTINLGESVILDSFGLIFEADITNDLFKVIRGDSSFYLSYLPKNYNELVTHLKKFCHEDDLITFIDVLELEKLQRFYEKKRTKRSVSFRTNKDGNNKMVTGFLKLMGDGTNITKIYGAFDNYDISDYVEYTKSANPNVDEVTGIKLEKAERTEMEHRISKASPTAKSILIYIDIDEMNMINTIFGYQYGNNLLKDFAILIQSINNPNATVLKGSSDKFIVYLDNIKRQTDIILFVEKLHTLLRRNYRTDNENGVFTVTMGISRFPEDGKSYRQLCSAAEYACRSAKLNGKDTYLFFNKGMHNSAAFFTDYDTGVTVSEGDAFDPRFSPVVDARTGNLVCYDYIPCALTDGAVSITNASFYEINKNNDTKKNTSLLSIKSLMYMLLGLKTRNISVPPVTIYTLFGADDLTGLVKELKVFTNENDFSDIRVCLALPQAILEEANFRALTAFTSVMHEIGFYVGLYMVGDKYIHNNCYNGSVFDRYILSEDFFENYVKNNISMQYVADTLSNLKEHTALVSAPLEISETIVQSYFDRNGPDISVTYAPVVGVEEMIADFKMREETLITPKFVSKPNILPFNASAFLYDICKTNCVVSIWDLDSNKISFTENVNEFFGADIVSYINSLNFHQYEKFIHEDDVDTFNDSLNICKTTLNKAAARVRLYTSQEHDNAVLCDFSMICVINKDGIPIRIIAEITKADSST